ncbi:MAG TPA: DUF4038 domain-containing protein [Devosia sp.]
MTHVWEKVEVPLRAQGTYENAYVEVDVWVDLEGPGFSKRVYGFWDGEQDFVVRVLATRAGTWKWTSGSAPHDAGLAGKSGTFEAVAWSEAELAENPNRRGMIVASGDGRGLEYADGTPYFLIGDTWWSVPSYRFPLALPDNPQPLGPNATLNDLTHHRLKQGYNCVGMIAAQPGWANDGHPPVTKMADGTFVRSAWRQPGTQSGKDMHNEGGRPFLFPGKVPGFEEVMPDLDRINPEYFKVVDQKVDYLNSVGMVPFIEFSRRDSGQVWKKYHDFNESYSRYVNYCMARWHANVTLLSPIHFDSWAETIHASEYSEAIELAIARHGKPPFGTLLTANPQPSTLVNFGADSWVDLHQSGNVREHYTYWYLTEIFQAEPKKPAINGEPYYAGLHQLGTPYPLRVPPDSEADQFYVRSGLYGSFLSGGLAGFIYGAEGIWNAEVEPEAVYPMWKSFAWQSGEQIQHVKTFAMVRGMKYRELVPDAELVMPNKSAPDFSYYGWAYCARVPDKSLFLLYFENEAPLEAKVRGLTYGAQYRATWFDPRSGEWGTPSEPMDVPRSCVMALPDRPDGRDWGLMLERV